MNSNPVLETFSELFKPLERAKPEPVDYRAKGRQDLEDWANQNINAIFSKALGVYSGVTLQVTEEVVKSPGDTIQYNVNEPSTWANFLPPDFLEAELPATPKRKRRRK